MNSFMQQFGQIFEMTQSLRAQVMDTLSDEDLNYTPGGEALTLGALCREMGEVERAYIDSLKTRTMTFSVEAPANVEESVETLKNWYAELDAELKALMQAFSEEDLQHIVDRGQNFKIPVSVQLHVYREALLIFYGKVSVYLKAVEKPLPGLWAPWIG